MGIFDNHFEKTWAAIFIGLYAFIFIPFPWFYNESYVPSFFGVPLFVYAWATYGAVVFITIIIFAKQCLKRKEYRDIEEVGGEN